MAPTARLNDDCIARYLWEAAQAGVERHTVLDVIRLWAENGTSVEEIARALDTVEASEVALHVRLVEHLHAVRQLLDIPEPAIDLTVPQQRTAEGSGRR